jgi:HAD superfamily hydrolase (TIGR01509 family)
VDTNDLHTAAWREAFLRFGYDFEAATIRQQVGKGGDNLIPSLIPGVAEAHAEEIDAWRGDLFKRDYLPRATPFPGVRPLFERLVADKVRIVLASSSSKMEVDFHLSLIGCADLVCAVTTRDDVESSKPCPDIFASALEKVAPVRADEALVIGDTPWDVKAAARAGLRTLAFLSGGFAEAKLREAGAAFVYQGAQDLLAGYDTSPFGAAAYADA